MTDLADLLKQRSYLDALIASHKTESIARVYAFMQEMNVSIADMGFPTADTPKPVGPKFKRPVKYRDEAGINTWTGVGQRPRWIRDRLLAGATLEQFAVPK